MTRFAARHETSQARGLLPLLHAVLDGTTDLELASLGVRDAELAIEIGLGAALASATLDSASVRTSALFERIQAAEMMARWTTADLVESVRAVLGASRALGFQPVLLKGGATALRLYPEPHLRLMTDLDLLVPPGRLAALESQLRALDFEQTSHKPAGTYDTHHHLMPFLDRQRNVWVELHTRLYPPTSRLADDARFSVDAIEGDLAPLEVGSETALVMNDELQLIYTCTRWAEALKPRHGVFPMLDVALLLRGRAEGLDWDRVCARVDRSWAATALGVMLGYLHRRRLAVVPPEVLRKLRTGGAAGERLVDALLDRLVTTFIIEGRPPGALATPANLRTIWWTLLQSKSPWAKLADLAPNIVFPPDRSDRFDLRTVVTRARSRFGPGRTKDSR